jgi:hypothetical protein
LLSPTDEWVYWAGTVSSRTRMCGERKRGGCVSISSARHVDLPKSRVPIRLHIATRTYPTPRPSSHPSHAAHQTRSFPSGGTRIREPTFQHNIIPYLPVVRSVSKFVIERCLPDLSTGSGQETCIFGVFYTFQHIPELIGASRRGEREQRWRWE